MKLLWVNGEHFVVYGQMSNICAIYFRVFQKSVSHNIVYKRDNSIIAERKIEISHILPCLDTRKPENDTK